MYYFTSADADDRIVQCTYEYINEEREKRKGDYSFL